MESVLRRTRCISLPLAGLLLFTLPGFGQVKSSTITGTVRDKSGAVVPNVDVTVTNQSTNITAAVKTTSSGDYTVPYLEVGKYTVTVRAPGFDVFNAKDIQTSTNQSVRVDAELAIGQTSVSVEVSAAAAQIQTDSSTVQGEVDARTIESIPNINENPLYYATLQPGVVGEKSTLDTTSQDSFGIGPHSRRYLSEITINGALALTNDIQLDGVPIMSGDFNEAAVMPNSEGLQEVRVQTNNYSADYGRGSGVIQYTTKSGTNQYHGSLIYKLRNEALNANGFANNENNVSRGAYKVDYYGGSFGGPIIKDKLFFFASYEGLYHTNPVDFFMTVPTAAERNGDFSHTLVAGDQASCAAVGKPANCALPLQLYDPFHVTQVAPNVYQRALIPNAIITNPDPGALKLFNSYPLPNRTPTDVYNSNNFYTRKAQTYHRNSEQTRLDYRLGNSHNIYAAGGIEKGDVKVPQPFGPDNPFYPPATWGQVTTDSNPYASLGDTITMSPTVLLDVRYGINRQNNVEGYGPKSKPFDLSGWNVNPAITAIAPDPTEPPDFCPSGRFSCLNYTSGQHINEHQTNQNIVGNVTKAAGKWTYRAGAEYRVMEMNTLAPNHALFEAGNWWGQQNYTNEYIDAVGNGVGGPNYNHTAQQNGLQDASWLLGAGYISAESSLASAVTMKYGALYTQNDWKPTSKLTVNLGLRWEVQPGPTERNDNEGGFDLNRTNPFGGQGSYAFAARDGYSRNLWDTNWRDFSPRLGFAYRLRDNWVVRGGYGWTYVPTNTGLGFTAQFTQPFIEHTAENQAGVFGPTPHGVPVGNWTSLAANPIVPAVGANISNPLLYGNGGTDFFPRNYQDGRVQQTNLFIERSIGTNLVLTLGYAGAFGSHLQYRNVPMNSLQTLSDSMLNNYRDQYIASGGQTQGWTAQVANPYANLGFQPGPISGATVQQWLLQAPYPMFPGLQVYQSASKSRYNSLVFAVNRTFSSGFQFNANYVWSKSIDDTQGFAQANDSFSFTGEQNTGYLLDLRNWNNNYHLSYNDIPHRLNLTGLYELPFGKGKPFFQSGVLGAVFGGWRIGSSFRFMMGTPIEIKSSAGALNGRADRIPGVPILLPSSERHWYATQQTITAVGPGGATQQFQSCSLCYEMFNPLAWQGQTVNLAGGGTAADPFWFGTAAITYNDIRNPNFYQLDSQLQREFRVTEKIRFQIAVNASNVLNTVNIQPTKVYDVGGFNDATKSPLLNGYGNGAFGLSTYDPRQLEIQARIAF
jgi:hypothetical protein